MAELARVQERITKLEGQISQLENQNDEFSKAERLAVRKELAPLRDKELLLLQSQGPAAGGTPAAAAPSPTDRTRSWLQNYPEVDSIPRFDQLYEVFTSRVHGDQRVKLPVYDERYKMLTSQAEEWSDWVEPVSKSGAYDLAALVEFAVTGELEEPASEMFMPGFIDPLFYRVMRLKSRKAASLHLTCQRNATEESITVSKLRPDFMLLAGDALLFKGEDKARQGDLPAAKTELIAKMADWSAAYHDTVEYMLCYAAAGLKLQFCAIQRSRPGECPLMTDVMQELDLSSPLDRLRVIHTALLTYSIITKQHAQLPRDHKPLGLEVQRPRGCSITYFANCVVKRVQLDQDPLLQPIVDSMAQLYAATSGCDFIIKGTVRITRRQYVVQLSPLATGMAGPPLSEQELAAAVRCILYALRCLHSIGWGHGDLRWANVVLESAGRYRVIDLESTVPLNSKPQLAGVRAWGSEAEALEDGEFTAQSDLYMVGKMMQQAAWLAGGASLATKLVAKQLTVDEALQDGWFLQALGAG